MPVDLSKTGKVVWRIPEDKWKYTGEVKVALELDNNQMLPSAAFQKESMGLRVVMDAKATTYEPPASGMKEVLQANRLICNWYFTTDEPLSPEARIWESGGSSFMEFGLCGANRYPWEDTIIEMDVLRADPILSKANPRLIAYGDYDYAVLEHIGLLRFLRDTILVLLALCVVIMAYYGIKPKSNQDAEVKVRKPSEPQG